MGGVGGVSLIMVYSLDVSTMELTVMLYRLIFAWVLMAKCHLTSIPQMLIIFSDRMF